MYISNGEPPPLPTPVLVTAFIALVLICGVLATLLFMRDLMRVGMRLVEGEEKRKIVATVILFYFCYASGVGITIKVFKWIRLIK